MNKEWLEEITSNVDMLLSDDGHVLLRRKHYEWIIEGNKRYREALEFYANRDNYKLEHFDPNLDDYMSTVDYDEGQKARQALEESK